MQTYAATLLALQQGGAAPYPPGGSVRLPAPKDARLKAQLATVESAWKETKTSLESVASLPAGSAAFKEALALGGEQLGEAAGGDGQRRAAVRKHLHAEGEPAALGAGGVPGGGGGLAGGRGMDGA